MAAIALANPLSTGALTKNQFAPQSEYPVANSAALTAPREQVFIVSTQAGAYHVVVRNIPPAPAQAIPTWVRPTIAAFFRIQNLADNWDSYGGKAINPDLIRESLDTLGMVMQPDSPTPSVVPMGEVVFKSSGTGNSKTWRSRLLPRRRHSFSIATEPRACWTKGQLVRQRN
jgi:hypothetical protein